MANSRFRNILAVVLGLILAFVSILFLEGIGHKVYPPSEEIIQAQKKLSDIDPREKEQRQVATEEMRIAMKDYLDHAPPGAMIMVLVAWFCAALFGSFLATAIAASYKIRIGMAVGVAVLLMTILNFVNIPYHPIWMMVVAILCIPLFAWLGSRASLMVFPNPNQEQ